MHMIKKLPVLNPVSRYSSAFLKNAVAHHVSPVSVDAAPVLNLDHGWRETLFGRSLDQCHSELLRIAEDASMAIGITDQHGTLLWTWSSHSMRSSAEQVHFFEGGQWSTQSVGTNAIGLALNTHAASCVYSHENQMNSVRDWVCYAAPIIDPQSGQFHGIINLSTKYEKHNSLGVLAVERCADLVQRSIRLEQQNVLYLKVLGGSKVQFNHHILQLTHRQIEILCILALCPDGISLDELHYALYGDRQVSQKTLKAELSQMRSLLHDCIQSRPYKLNCEVQADFLMAEQALNLGFTVTVLALYKGNFLSKTESPFLCAWRDCFDARLSHMIHNLQDIDQLFRLISRVPERTDAIERLLELLPEDSPHAVKLKQLLE
ncbi:transcriptional regulator [Acinetobacter radioresistens]|uniref:transcriptional regulator n=1 Tax=Acinetobacter radioresistens TaxID=40216 RepID=UPI0012502FA2|nr:transcriptional regulator [Acinetobacter radioresistens]